jgi:hypothetical protein
MLQNVNAKTAKVRTRSRSRSSTRSRSKSTTRSNANARANANVRVNATANANNPVILKSYIDTQYISQNKRLIKIFNDLFSKKITPNEDIYSLIASNNWLGLDAYIAAHNGPDEFFRIIAQIFLFYYFIKNISYHQYQTALGIQQVRWMNDVANNRIMQNYRIVGITPSLWDGIDPSVQTEILAQFKKRIQNKVANKTEINDVKFNESLSNTIWYKLDQPGAQGLWGGYGPDKHWYTIPETFYYPNTCIYRPMLVFGTISEKTLLNFIIEHKMRPYAAHFPGAISNLVNIHDHKHGIVHNWQHDFSHSSGGATGCDLIGRLRFLNFTCKPTVPFTKDNLINNEELKDCIHQKKLNPLALTNTGSTLHNLNYNRPRSF